MNFTRRWHSRRFLRTSGTLLGQLALVTSLGQAAQAQTRIPAHQTDRNAATGACTVRLLPDAVTGESAPVLVVTTTGTSGSNALGVAAQTDTPTTRLELVFANTRTAFEPLAPAQPRALKSSQVWKTLVEAEKQERPFFLTARGLDGRYSSARYQALETAGLMAILETQCGFSPDALNDISDAQLLARETALGLNEEQVRHIRWILHSRYSEATTAPIPVASLTDIDRTYLERYSAQIGDGKTRFLNSALASRLLRQEFIPVQVDRSGSVGFVQHQNWQAYWWNANRCAVSTFALSWAGENFYLRPEMLFTAQNAAPGNAMFFNMVTPNPFYVDSPVAAVVDGRSYRLQQVDGRILPPSTGDGVNDAVMKAIRRGTNIEIRGTGKFTGRPLSLYFSANGFTGAFTQMMRNCQRPTLQDWFR